MGSIKWKKGIGYGTSGGMPHLVSTDGRFEVYKYEKTYNLRRYIVSRGYKVISTKKEFGFGLFDKLKDAKLFVENWVAVHDA